MVDLVTKVTDYEIKVERMTEEVVLLENVILQKKSLENALYRLDIDRANIISNLERINKIIADSIILGVKEKQDPIIVEPAKPVIEDVTGDPAIEPEANE